MFSNYGYSAGFEEHECLSVCKLPLSIILLFASWNFRLIIFVSNKVFLHVLKHVPCFYKSLFILNYVFFNTYILLWKNIT